MDIKPLRRIEHFLAKIAGSEYAKDLTPITRKEYWLNEIAKNGGGSGGGVLICTDTDGTLDKTMGEIQAAFLLNSRIDLQNNSDGGVSHSIAVHLLEVHLDERSNTYNGSVTFANTGNALTPHKLYTVSAATEEAALAAYPTNK